MVSKDKVHIYTHQAWNGMINMVVIKCENCYLIVVRCGIGKTHHLLGT